MRETAENVSSYAKLSSNKNNEEIRNELLTKEAIEALTPQEKRLLQYLSQ